MKIFNIIWDDISKTSCRRSLIAQHQAKIEEAVEQAKALRKAMKSGQIASDVSTLSCVNCNI